jgi:hypothetical protein
VPSTADRWLVHTLLLNCDCFAALLVSEASCALLCMLSALFHLFTALTFCLPVHVVVALWAVCHHTSNCHSIRTVDRLLLLLLCCMLLLCCTPPPGCTPAIRAAMYALVRSMPDCSTPRSSYTTAEHDSHTRRLPPLIPLEFSWPDTTLELLL